MKGSKSRDNNSYAPPSMPPLLNSPFQMQSPAISADKSAKESAWQNLCGSDSWQCDICGEFFEPPVTYHMKIAHPGCGDPAGGKGYNSSGQYCGGWAGNCGDGGGGGSPWYLICEICRDSHKKKGKSSTTDNFTSGGGGNTDSKDKSNVMIPLPSMLASLSYATANSPVGPLDCHIIMKANSMFLLDLASSTEEEHSR